MEEFVVVVLIFAPPWMVSLERPYRVSYLSEIVLRNIEQKSVIMFHSRPKVFETIVYILNFVLDFLLNLRQQTLDVSEHNARATQRRVCRARFSCCIVE